MAELQKYAFEKILSANLTLAGGDGDLRRRLKDSGPALLSAPPKGFDSSDDGKMLSNLQSEMTRIDHKDD